ncbi:probable inactive histone-lysine N-methyltransferase SUVR2 isoform X1 [Tripterygium wilfordii]|uniref:probable inactive histone-lysine N-methyltransferase SUVR2 isoform X1 n=1 Tax=Tripterygium wilfordii TaxID=458696 RepID=UPI0018F825D0|nr:probable inactive histone-lysine N-methyltransferase SUVR2 isoform X1 [Tripterygium wilfordii]XP_038706311.1 probable inactive histone-lysine N-methyltransferase SUVR2 isoform X1 [Tripterygium wilfordii]XP_038706312.1 probable inactive histone-lysine N-methyltransferase SUVR2 isoform X1 [Tripterygium wilfordii]XP_038706313.1 probable inactive histone-lysine N-methyltransferase SUVR2 isoform X1 [Tripterygium wilfordii]XP_038706314.1 probable inactive histone-lysine N-methyltransferase SUVR2 i
MEPNPRFSKAFRDMKAIGITEDKVQLVLKKLLKLYDKKWKFIEEENYRVPADAIVDRDDTQECEKKPNGGDDVENFDEESEMHVVPQSLKRLRLRGREGQMSSPSKMEQDATSPATLMVDRRVDLSPPRGTTP